MYGSVGTVTTPHCGLDRSRSRGSIPHKGVRFHSAPKRPNWFRGTLSPLFNENQGQSPDGKLVGRGAIRLPPFSAKDKNDWNHTTSAPYAFTECRERTLILQYG